MGYSEVQRDDLAATINASDADVVLIATPIDLRKVCDLSKPAVRASYELEPVSSPGLDELLLDKVGAG
jgi:predicted GTPase